ncbi:hypothetical protein SAMN05421642_1081, partial [Rhodococcoides kyotonense]
LCRYHHSLKTMGAWHPTMLAGAIEYWQSNSGSTAVTLPGNTIGTTDLTGHTLTPHIPRKRRPKHTTEPDTAQADSEQKEDQDKEPTTTTATITAAPGDTASTTRPRPTPTTCWSMKLSPGERADADDPAPY